MHFCAKKFKNCLFLTIFAFLWGNISSEAQKLSRAEKNAKRCQKVPFCSFATGRFSEKSYQNICGKYFSMSSWKSSRWRRLSRSESFMMWW